jgi:hypothetical protein
MNLENHSFSFFPFGALFCLTLFCFVAVRIVAICYRYRDSNQQNLDMVSILKRQIDKGEFDEAEFQRLKELLTK